MVALKVGWLVKMARWLVVLRVGMKVEMMVALMVAMKVV